MTIPDSDLEQWQQVCDAATPGPWVWDLNPAGQSVNLYSTCGLQSTVMDCVRWGMGKAAVRFNLDGLMVRCDSDQIAKVIPGREHHKGWARQLDHPDAIFITLARTAMPRLIAEVRMLKQQLARPGHHDVDDLYEEATP